MQHSKILKVLANRTYGHLLGAQVVALVGTGLATVALGLLAYDIAGGNAGAVLGTALAIKMAAYIGVAPVVGAFADRLPRRAFLVAMDLLRCSVALALPFVSAVWQVYVLIFVLQSASAAFTPTFQATIPDVLPEQADYTRALSLSRLAYDLESLLSPMLAAALLSVMSFHWLFAGTAVGFIGSAMMVLSVRLPKSPAKPRSSGIYAHTTRGIRFYLKTPRLRGLLAVNLAAAAASSMVIVNTVVIVRNLFGLGQGEVAWTLAAYGGGSMLAALVLPRLLDRLADRTIMLAASFMLTALLAVAGTVIIGPASDRSDWPLLLGCWVLLGVAYSMSITPSGRLLRRSAGESDRPAVFAAQCALSHVCWLVAYPLAGQVGANWSQQAAFLVLAALAAAGTIGALVVWPSPGRDQVPHDHASLDPIHPHVAAYFTPSSIVKLIVEVIEPYHGKIFDPACGSGGMFVHSAEFVRRHHQSPSRELSVYGTEKMADNQKLCRLNLAVHGLSGDIRIANSYYEDPHGMVGKFDFVMAKPPRGRAWSPSSFVGEASRGAGMLRNPIYRGELVWNKVTMVKDPSTGRRVSRPNPHGEWLHALVPELRIVSDELFEAVQAQLQSRSKASLGERAVKVNRPKRLLSGLLKCGACGSGMSVGGTDRSGRARLRCSGHVNSGSCPDPHTFYLDTVEALVLDSLSYQLSDPKLLYEYAEEYQAERRRLNGSKARRIAELKSRIAFIDKDNARLLDWALRDLGQPEQLLARMKEQGLELDRLKEELAAADEAEFAIDLHPVALKRYTDSIASVRALLGKEELAGDSETAKQVREVIENVTVYRRDDTEKGVEIEVVGRFSPFMTLPGGNGGKAAAALGGPSVPQVVAEEGLEPPTRGL